MNFDVVGFITHIHPITLVRFLWLLQEHDRIHEISVDGRVCPSNRQRYHRFIIHIINECRVIERCSILRFVPLCLYVI